MKQLISICELSSQTLFSHGRADLKPFDALAMFLPKQIASKNDFLDYSDLEVKHMAFLLRRSLFTVTKKSEIRTMLQTIEKKSQSENIW